MADDITNGELARRLDDLRGAVARLIGRDEYAADQRGDDRRFADLARDIAAVREQLTDDVKELRDDMAEAKRSSAEHRQSWRTVIYTGLIPAAVVLLSVLVQLWLSRGR